MSTRRSLALPWILFVVLAVTLGAAPLQRSGPPDVVPGTKLYALRMVRPTAELWPTAGPATPFEVRAVRDSWLLLESPVIQRGPVWVNFEHIITFRHEP